MLLWIGNEQAVSFESTNYTLDQCNNASLGAACSSLTGTMDEICFYGSSDHSKAPSRYRSY